MKDFFLTVMAFLTAVLIIIFVIGGSAVIAGLWFRLFLNVAGL